MKDKKVKIEKVKIDGKDQIKRIVTITQETEQIVNIQELEAERGRIQKALDQTQESVTGMTLKLIDIDKQIQEAKDLGF